MQDKQTKERDVYRPALDQVYDLTLQKVTVNFLNIRTPWKFAVITLKIWTMWLYHILMSPNDADGMANSVDPRSSLIWSALFAQAYLSENLGSLR